MTAKRELVIGGQPWQRAASIWVRMNVFVIERGIALQDEFDANDEKGVTYAVIYEDQRPIACGRFLREGEDAGRLTRIATLADYRGQHLGSQIIAALERHAQSLHIKNLSIHAELTAVSFYTRLGYRNASPVYLEDGVACRTLVRQL
ncbi:GNAT family N-acetyltransferase [Lacticaseibacillus zhaodongensis]|uniref:GNAT family N-acetyltransferase n=1 Tax=Lacticaseibacillus zhaodongensis TaxID=2668065 RepID=UPI0012D2EE92|nr:GNAT family N-acetyltransferase [Lacticaseibacillus zhaodongensis]